MNLQSISIRMFFACMLAMSAVSVARAADAPEGDGTLHEKLVKEYLAGNWAELTADVKVAGDAIDALGLGQKADVDYVKKALAEGRPAWWESCKAGKKCPISAVIFGHRVLAVYDPAQKINMQFNIKGSHKEFGLNWPADEMDNPAPAEHGFTKGELNGLSVWSSLAIAAEYNRMPIDSLLHRTEAEKALMFRALDFDGYLAGVYYGSPRTRRWAYFLALHTYMDKYAKMQVVMSRKAVGAMFIEEVAANPGKYPSIQLPAKVDADNAEAKLALALQSWVEKHAWTFPEDKSLRDAAIAFAAANDDPMKTGGLIKLPNGLQISLDPDKDPALRGKRDAWVVEQLAKEK